MTKNIVYTIKANVFGSGRIINAEPERRALAKVWRKSALELFVWAVLLAFCIPMAVLIIGMLAAYSAGAETTKDHAPMCETREGGAALLEHARAGAPVPAGMYGCLPFPAGQLATVLRTEAEFAKVSIEVWGGTTEDRWTVLWMLRDR